VSELGGAAHQGGADGATTTVVSGGSGGALVALRQRPWTGGKGGGRRGVLVVCLQRRMRGEKKWGRRHQVAPFNGVVEGGGSGQAFMWRREKDRGGGLARWSSGRH
jgi:hypothetical protein